MVWKLFLNENCEMVLFIFEECIVANIVGRKWSYSFGHECAFILNPYPATMVDAVVRLYLTVENDEESNKIKQVFSGEIFELYLQKRAIGNEQDGVGFYVENPDVGVIYQIGQDCGSP